MKRICIAFLLALLPATVAFPVDTVVMPAPSGQVTFDHKAHSESMACTVCHGEGVPDRVELDRQAAHELCRGCHQKQGAGPVRCDKCHRQ